uniref:CUB domain-containing protein n=1 Tax=Plectus sambesii TaxID=2011161 RepID=A0A914VXU3_9BILA
MRPIASTNCLLSAPTAVLRTVALILIAGVLRSYAILPYEMEINYLDGTGPAECRSKLEKRVSGMSGIIYSHQPYDEPYGAGKNCFIMVVVPAGFRIRLKVFDFNVNGLPDDCKKDSLHVFDHEEQVNDQEETDPDKMGPGPIVGQFCGRKRNGTELVTSSHNALTLWWHTDAHLPRNHSGRGFRLLFSAFRNGTHSGCNPRKEFSCHNSDCIPTQLACDRIANCKDDSDLEPELQKSHGCENIYDGYVLDSLHGAALLGVCLAAVIGSVLLCVVISICCRGMRTPVKNPQTSGPAAGYPPPGSQTFAVAASPRRTPIPSAYGGGSFPYTMHLREQQLHRPMIADDYGRISDDRQHGGNESIYTYYNNHDARTTLLVA